MKRTWRNFEFEDEAGEGLSQSQSEDVMNMEGIFEDVINVERNVEDLMNVVWGGGGKVFV